MATTSRVYLVGAGPGDPDLITIKGWQLVQTADALIYDALVAPELVCASRAEEVHYVGKTAGGAARDQAEINALLINLGRRRDAAGRPRYPVIVRLKGGDPYVFGRGGEEALALRDAGIDVEVVPGITAASAAGAYAGVPLTDREHSAGVVFCTGHRAREAAEAPGDEDTARWAALVRSGLTLCIYMGVASLAETLSGMIAAGLDPLMPGIVIQEGTMPGQRTVRAPVRDLAERAAAAQVRPPAVVIIGRVVGFSEHLAPQAPRPLAGRTVVLLRAEESRTDALAPLRLAGARVIEAAVVRCVADETDAPAVRAAMATIAGDDVVLFTTPSAVRFFAGQWRTLPARAQPRFAGRNAAALAEIRRQGFDVAIEPTGDVVDYTDGFLAQSGLGRGARVWLPRSRGASALIPEELRRAGYDVRELVLYDTVPVPLSADVVSLLAGGRADWLLLSSGTAVRAAVAAVPSLPRRDAGGRPRVAVVGRVAASVAEREGLRCEIVAPRPRLGDLVAAVIEAAT